MTATERLLWVATAPLWLGCAVSFVAIAGTQYLWQRVMGR